MVTATYEWAYNDIRSVILENQFLKLTIFPQLGAKIYDLIYKPRRKNILWHNLRIPPSKVPFGAAFDDVWSGGWDEIFPNDAPSSVGNDRYPDMGEIWSIDWDYSITHQTIDEVTLTTSTYSHIAPCKITRHLTLGNESNFHLKYEIENVGQETVKFLWKLHPAFDINEHCIIEIPGKTAIVDARYQHLFSPSSHTYPWPDATMKEGQRRDFSRVTPQTDQTCTEHYINDLTGGWIKLKDLLNKIETRITFPKEILNSVCLFLAYGGWRSIYTAVIEPSTSYGYDLAQAIREGHVHTLKSGGKLECPIEVYVKDNEFQDNL